MAKNICKHADRKKALPLAQSMQNLICFEAFAQQCISPTYFTTGAPDLDGRMYIALGGPGTGNTSTKLFDALKWIVEQGRFALLTSNLNELRNNHVEMFAKLLGPALFEQRVRVQGCRNLSKLAKSRALSVLTWDIMHPLVADYECQIKKNGRQGFSKINERE